MILEWGGQTEWRTGNGFKLIWEKVYEHMREVVLEIKRKHRPFNELYYVNWFSILKKKDSFLTVPQNKLHGLYRFTYKNN